ncbi:NAD(P)H-hydrate dehydratase [Pantanalinema rosaneae CENA516]|uniref:NAD(P)H-hydrate dehydratase n=1 Tax=Pantanalinema rosaneae TaxID=1620701 RepID=UPI003D6F1DB3
MQLTRSQQLQTFVVTAEQMRQIEGRVFAAGMPVAALMEKVAGLIVDRLISLYPSTSYRQVGVLVGPGHNGGDALVVARELQFRGYQMSIYRPFSRFKELTAAHAQYCDSLEISQVEHPDALQSCDLLIDGLFGFGLERAIEGNLAAAIDQINQFPIPIVSIDLPSGLHTDTGKVLGTAIRATRTFCLGLWKQGLLQDWALEYTGQAELIDFDLPLADIYAILGDRPAVNRMTPERAISALPLTRPASTHKYKQGHLLLICGSYQYAGAAILSGLGARASGVGMLSIAVPQSIKPLLTTQLPEALILGCPETTSGAIAHLPEPTDLSKYDAIACGCGLTITATPVVEAVLATQQPLLLDADGLNILANLGTIPTLQSRSAPTILTPHLGEFQRLFPDLTQDMPCRVTAVRQAATQTQAIVLLKGARVAIADTETVWINPDSTPALARGGSGDVLTGLTGGLLAQLAAREPEEPKALQQFSQAVQVATWWHSQAGIFAAQSRTELGVDAHTLTNYLLPALHHAIVTEQPSTKV